jgi:GT2 family glycosyltransferase
MRPSRSRVGVVVVTRNRIDGLLGTIERLRTLPEAPPVVVVDNDSTDGTLETLEAVFPDLLVLQAGANLGAAGRTLGARVTGTPYVAFSDDDSWWAPGALERAAALLDAHPRTAVLAGRVLLGPEERLDPACRDMATSPLPAEPDLPGRPVLGFIACGAVVRRSAFLHAGGFHPRFGVGGEEGLLAADLVACGWGVCYVESLVAHHHPSPVRDRADRTRRTVRNDLWTTWLRRRPIGALRRTGSILRSAVRDSAAIAGVGEAVRGLPWVLRERRPVSASLEQTWTLLDVRPTAVLAADR